MIEKFFSNSSIIFIIAETIFNNKHLISLANIQWIKILIELSIFTFIPNNFQKKIYLIYNLINNTKQVGNKKVWCNKADQKIYELLKNDFLFDETKM